MKTNTVLSTTIRAATKAVASRVIDWCKFLEVPEEEAVTTKGWYKLSELETMHIFKLMIAGFAFVHAVLAVLAFFFAPHR